MIGLAIAVLIGGVLGYGFRGLIHRELLKLGAEYQNVVKPELAVVVQQLEEAVAKAEDALRADVVLAVKYLKSRL